MLTEEEITFELHDKIRDSYATRYYYRIIVNGKPTCLMYCGDSEWKHVRGSISIDVDINDELRFISTFDAHYEINVDGTIVHGKKQVVAEWKQIKEWAVERLNVINKSVSDTLNILEEGR